MPELSIIIVNYKTPELVVDCVASIRRTCNANYEILIVENGSGDNSVETLKKLVSKNTLLVVQKYNKGFAAGNNIGIKKAKGRYLLLLNSDTVVKPGAIDKLLAFAKQTPNAGVVGPKLLNKDGSVQGSVFRLPTPWLAIKQYWLGRGKPMEKYAPDTKKPIVVPSLVMAAYLITPTAFSKVGLLDERYFMFFEDIDYSRRVAGAGLKNYYLPTAQVIHLHGASGKDLKEDKEQWRRLIPSSKIYHGVARHYIINFILWSGQKWQNLIS